MGVGGLLQSLGDAISGLMRGVIAAIEAAVQGVFRTFEALLPFPWWLVVLAALLLGAAWLLARR